MDSQDRIDQIIVELQANEFSVKKIAKEFIEQNSTGNMSNEPDPEFEIN